MSYEIKMILIYTVVFVIIGLFLWLYISMKNKKEKDAMNRDYDYENSNEESDEETLADYENSDNYIMLPDRRGDATTFDSIDDFLNNFSYREDNYDIQDEDRNEPVNLDYTVSITPVRATSTEVVNVLIGTKSYIFLANGNRLSNGTKIILRINNKNYNGVVVKENYERDLSSLSSEPKPLDVVEIINN